MGKRNGTSLCAGGSDPTKLLGGLAAEKWGRSRPIWTFSHGDFPFPLFRISPCSKHFGPLGVKPVAISSMQSATFTFFTRAQQSQHERHPIQPFKSIPREPAPHLVAENQISLAYFSVKLLLPRLPHSEVPKQVLDNVRFERNLHEGMKDFRGLWEVQIGPGSVNQPELAELTEEGEVAV